MSISFSGLTTGLDTSSWVESLVKIKQEKVSSYESTKKTLELTQEAVASIKSFFTSFRSVLEKVTDTKFGTAASDIFAQKLASSTNANLVSASATHEAEEAKYDVNVDKLATQTKANSGIKQLETITQIQTATLNTKLGDLGVKNGTIDVTVKGVKNNITISEDNSIADFITKLKNVGVESNFNEKTGVFSIDLPSGNIVDNGTGIIDAFHLQSSGYESTNLVTYTTSTVTSTATGNTKLSELDNGSILKSGTIQLEVNGTTHNISINKDETLSEFVNTLKSYGVDAELADDGTLTIKDATITDIGNTKLLDVLGLHSDVSSKSQTAEGLKATTIIITGIEATGATTLGELDGWKNISGTPQLVAVDAQGNKTTIDYITEDTTLNYIVSALNHAGLKAELKNGILSVREGSVSGNVADLLGLTDKNNKKVSITSNNLRSTIVTQATGNTKLSDLGIDVTSVTSVPCINIIPKNGNAVVYNTLDANATLNDYFSILSSNGINASINNGKITIESSNGNYDTGRIAKALGLSNSSSSVVTSNSAFSSTPISYTLTHTANANTTFGELGLGGKTYEIKGSGFSYYNQGSVDSSTTFAELASNLKNTYNIDLSINNGVVSITSNNGYVFSGELAEALGVQTTMTSNSVSISGKNTTSTVALTYTISVVATGSSKISDFVDLDSRNQYNVIQLCNQDGTVTGCTITSSTTFDDLIAWMAPYGINASMVDGRLQITNSNGAYIRDYYSSGGVLSKLGITTTTHFISTTVGEAYTGNTLYYTTSVTVTSSNASSVYLKDVVDGFVDCEEMVAYYDKGAMYTITVTNSMTVADLQQKLANLGLENVINSDGSITLNDISSNHRYVKGDFADRMGWTRGSSTTKGQAVTSGSSASGYITRSAAMTSVEQIMATVTLTQTQTATLDSKVSGCISNWDSIDKNIYLRTSAGNIVNTITVSNTSSFRDIFNNGPDGYMPRGGGSVSASMTNGILTLTQVAGTDTYENAGKRTSDYYYFTGEIVDALGIGTTSNGKTLVQTIGVSYTVDNIRTSFDGAGPLSGIQNIKLTDLRSNDNSVRLLIDGASFGVSWCKNEERYKATFTVSSTSTIESFVSWLNSTTGITSYILDDRIIFGGDNDNYIETIGAPFRVHKLFGIENDSVFKSTKTIEGKMNTSSNSQTEPYTYKSSEVATKTTKLTDLGFVEGKTYHYTYWEMYDSVFKTANIAVTSDSTIQTILDSFGNVGISHSFSDGKFTFNEGSGYYMTSMDFANLINVSIDPSKYYKSKYQTVVAGMTISNAIKGLLLNDDLISFSDGTSIKYTSNLMTFGDLQSALRKKGYDLSFYDGHLSISASTTSCITGFHSAISRGFSIYAGEGKTYYTHLTNSDSYALNRSTTALVTGSTKLTDLGCSIGSFNIFDMTALNSSGTAEYQYFTTTSDTTVNDFISWLESKGFSGSGISNGQITVGKNDNAYISWISSDFFPKLGLSQNPVNYYNVPNNMVIGNSDSRQFKVESILGYNEDTKFSDLGLILDGTIVVKGTYDLYTYTVAPTDTIKNMADKLSRSGLEVRFGDRGELEIICNTSYNYIKSMSDNLIKALRLPGAGKGYTYDEHPVNATYKNTTDGRTLSATSTELLDENTIIKNLDGYNHGNGTIKIKDFNNDSVDITITINQNGTLGDFFTQLRANGLIAGIQQYRVVIQDPDGGLHLASVDGGSNILSALALSAPNKAISNNTTQISDGRTLSYSTTSPISGSSEIGGIIDNNGNSINFVGNTPNSIIISTTDRNGNVNNNTIAVDKTQTVENLLATLRTLGIDAAVTNGKINLSSTSLKDFSITDLSGNTAQILFGNNKSFDISSNLNTKSVGTATTEATRDTLLRDLGVTSGEYYVYNNGVKYTAQIFDDETIGSFMNTLNSFGLQTNLVSTADGAKLTIIGNGDSYIAKSDSTTNASNVVEKLFTNTTNTKYNYVGTENVTTISTTTREATKDTLLSEFDLVQQGAQSLHNEGSLIFGIRGETKTVSITSTDTFGSLIDKLNNVGIASSFHDGKLYISDAYDVVHTGGTSQLLNILAKHTDSMSGFMASGDDVQETTTQIVEKDFSAANYADYNTVLGKLNIADGTFSIFRNGQKALIDIDSTKTFGDLRSQISTKFSDVDLKFEKGKLIIYSKTDGVSVEAGTTTDSSNLQAVVGLEKDESGMFCKSTRELYRVSTDTLVTAGGMFRLGDVTEGTFTVGNQEITIDKNTKLSDIINQINNSDAANSTAYWDSIDGKLVIQSRTTGAALINIEAGTSNFTDIMGYTNSKWKNDGSLDETRLSIDNQELGSNAKFTINGTKYSATSNTITSDITKIKGLTLNLKDITENNPVTITIEKDKDKVANAIESVVESYNELMKNVDEQISTTGKLHDQSTLKMIRNQLRKMMTGSDAGATVFRNLSAIGISVSSASANNTSTSNESIIDLSFDRDKFLEAYAKDADAVKALLVGGASNQGVFTKVENLLESSLKSVTGYFDVTEKSIKSDINKTAMKITKANEAIERYRAQLEKRFSSMNMMIAGMQQQYSSFLQS